MFAEEVASPTHMRSVVVLESSEDGCCGGREVWQDSCETNAVGFDGDGVKIEGVFDDFLCVYCQPRPVGSWDESLVPRLRF